MFWRRKPKAVPPMSVEEQLRQLAECGLVPTSQAAVESWLNDCDRAQLESPPFDLILHHLGNEYQDANENWHPSSDGLWCFDTECIEDADDYVHIIERLASMTRGDIKVADVRASIDDDAWVAFEANGKPIKWKIKVNDDWIDDTVLEGLFQLLVEFGSKRRFCAPPSGDQIVTIACLTREEFEKLNTLVAHKFEPAEPSW